MKSRDVVRWLVLLPSLLHAFGAKGAVELVPLAATWQLFKGQTEASENVLAIQAFSAALDAASFAVDSSLTAVPDEQPPGLETVVPSPGSALRELRTIEVRFDEPVAGLDAADLLVNGAAATNVVEFEPGQFVFSFPQPPDGTVSIRWAPDHGITDRTTQGNAFAAAGWAYQLDSGSPPPELIISEFMAENDRTLNDEDGDNSDWIELFNGHETAVNLDGWFLTDDAANLAKWRFPNVAIAPNEFMVVFASEKNRTNELGRLHTNFKLAAQGEYLALVSPRTNIMSEFAPAYPRQQTDVSYGRARGSDQAGYFVRPSPGAANVETGPGFAPEVGYSRRTGTFIEPFVLTLSFPSNAVVRYTLDGSLPTNSSPVYIAPIPITNSVQVRTRSYQPGLLPGAPRTETFLLLSNGVSAAYATNVLSFTSDLPVLVIHSLGKGAPTASRQNSAHLSLFEPINGLTSLTNAPTFTTRTGIKLRGSSTQGLAKSSFALEFWDEFNLDEDHELLGLPAESDWVLYAPNQFEPVLIHNPFIHQLSRDMGRYSPRTRFVEVFMNKGTGPISALNYSGIYVLEEKIKIGRNRVNIDKLKPEHVNPPEVSGGYLLKIDRLDPGDGGFSAGNQNMAYVDPKEREIELPQRDPQEQFIRRYFNDFSRALNGTNWLSPTLGYAAYIDVDAWVDFHVLEVLSGNVDAIVLSTYFHKPRGGKIVFGPHWDFDRALGSTDGRDSNPRTWQTGPFFSGWWNRLCRDLDFWQKWVDRYQELRESLFSQPSIDGLIDGLTAEVRQAQPRERAKWRIAPRGGSYQSEINLMKNWLSNRMVFIDRQLVQPPKLASTSGPVSSGFTVSLSGPTNATIYFTLDGSDPRLSQAGVSPKAQAYTGPIVVNQNARLVARAHNPTQRQSNGPPASSTWSRRAEATFTIAPPALLLTELMFHPEPAPASSTNSASDFEFLELKNVSAGTVHLPGYSISGSIRFTFETNGAVTSLAPGQRVLIVRNLVAFLTRYPSVTNIGGIFEGSLENSAGRLVMTGPVAEPIFDLTYSDEWQPLADGFGFSLVVADEALPPESVSAPSSWRLSAQPGGSPGRADPTPAPVPPVLVNELLPYPSPPTEDALELFNPSDQPVDVGGWWITDDYRTPRKFQVPPGTLIPARGYLRLNDFSLASGNLGFSRGGEQAYLFSADANGAFTGWLHGFDYGVAELDVSFGRHVLSTGAEVFVPQAARTLGATNSAPRIPPLIITEIMFAPPPDAGGSQVYEYVEIRNASAGALDLFDRVSPGSGWSVRGAVDYDFPPNTTLAPGAYRVLVSFDPQLDDVARARFQSRYGLDSTSLLLGPWKGALDNGPGVIRLLKPGEPQVQGTPAVTTIPNIILEQVSYASAPPWPADTLHTGLALARRAATAFADDPGNWRSALPTPGDSDADEDGLPDTWEAHNGLNALSAAGDDGPDGDPDGDGFTNLQELLGGTGPKDPVSQLGVSAIALEGRQIHLRFPAAAGRSYTIEYKDSLGSGPWRPVQVIIPSASMTVAPILDAGANGQGFYRIRMP